MVHVLPFGARASVLQFNRAVSGLRRILVECFRLPATNFYDDRPVVVPEVLTAVVDIAVSSRKIDGLELERRQVDLGRRHQVHGTWSDFWRSTAHVTLFVNTTPPNTEKWLRKRPRENNGYGIRAVRTK